MSAQREIKFRAWAEDKPALLSWNEIHHHPGWWLFNDAHPGWVVMQFTGLRDKNGKELYFDDVVALTNGQYDDYPNWRVVQDDFGTPGFMPVTDHWYFLTFEKYFLQMSTGRHAFEIIGNIYEHPHLLTDPAGVERVSGSEGLVPPSSADRGEQPSPETRGPEALRGETPNTNEEQ